jgi:hypothetical protein
MNQETTLKNKFQKLKPFLNEKQIRLYAAAESMAIGYSGISIVSRATGVSRRAITEGCKELTLPSSEASILRVRSKGAGRKKLTDTNTDLKASLERLIEPATRGDPESPLRWTSKSVRHLSNSLNLEGYDVSHQTVATLLKEMEYSLQANKKVIEGGDHPDRNDQFEYINNKAKKYQKEEQPVISVDTKKKELIGNFKNNGRELQPKGNPELVNVYDFQDKNLGKVSPYGVYDITNNVGWVNVGVDHDTAQFAVQSIRSWWYTMGSKHYPKANKLFITADGGGSNGSRVRLWKVELQKLSDELSMEISVSHFPPGTSKWNKIEHKLFSFISQNWRGKPLTSHQVVVSLIANTKTKTGLEVQCQLDDGCYEKGIKISDQQMKTLNLARDSFHGEWNYTIAPRAKL